MPTILSCEISGNAIAEGIGGGSSTRGLGAGVASIDSNTLVVNSRIWNNLAASSTGPVGGVYSEGSAGTLQIINSLIWSNAGSGINAISSEANRPTIVNTIVWGNLVAEEIVGEVQLSYSCVEGGGFDETSPTETNRDDCTNFYAAPGAADPQRDTGNTAALPPDTHDLDSDGNTAEPLPIDLDGNPRIVGAAVDMGAYEGQ